MRLRREIPNITKTIQTPFNLIAAIYNLELEK